MANLVPRPGKGSRPGGLVRQAQNAIERRVQSSHEEVVLQQSRFLARTLTWALIGCTGFALAWLSLAQTEEVVVAPGKLEPIGDVKTIQVPVGGVLDEMLVKDGERVSKGQVLMRLDNEATKDRELSLIKTISAKQQQQQLKEVELQRSLNFNDTEQAVSRRSSDGWRASKKWVRPPNCSISSNATACAMLKESLPRPVLIVSVRWPSLSSLFSSCAVSSPICRASSRSCV